MKLSDFNDADVVRFLETGEGTHVGVRVRQHSRPYMVAKCKVDERFSIASYRTGGVLDGRSEAAVLKDLMDSRGAVLLLVDGEAKEVFAITTTLDLFMLMGTPGKPLAREDTVKGLADGFVLAAARGVLSRRDQPIASLEGAPRRPRLAGELYVRRDAVPAKELLGTVGRAVERATREMGLEEVDLAIARLRDDSASELVDAVLSDPAAVEDIDRARRDQLALEAELERIEQNPPAALRAMRDIRDAVLEASEAGVFRSDSSMVTVTAVGGRGDAVTAKASVRQIIDVFMADEILCAKGPVSLLPADGVLSITFGRQTIYEANRGRDLPEADSPVKSLDALEAECSAPGRSAPARDISREER